MKLNFFNIFFHTLLLYIIDLNETIHLFIIIIIYRVKVLIICSF